MRQFSEQQDKHLHSFEHTADNLREMKKSFNSSVKDAFSNVKVTNGSLAENVKCVTKNESDFKDMAINAMSRFSKL